MKRIRPILNFLADESGATAIEYGLIAAGIALVVLIAVGRVGSNLSKTFNSVAASL